MVLTQADVAELSAWHQDRKGSLIKMFEERIKERKVVTGERSVLKELDRIKNDLLAKHNLRDARKQLDKLLGEKGDLHKFLSSFEEVTNYNFKMMSAIAYALEALFRLTEKAKAEHLEPEKMAKDTLDKLQKGGANLRDDMQKVRLMAQKIEALERKAA